MQRVEVALPTGRTTAWRVPGAGPPVVCLHGAGVSSRQFRLLLAQLEDRRETWALDMPGFGASAAPRPLILPELTDAIGRWLDMVAVGPALLLGTSFGCQVAVTAAVENPDTVSGLVLVGPTTDPAARTPARQLVRWSWNSLREPPRLTAELIRDYRDAGTRRVFATFAESWRDRICDRLPMVTQPTLVVRGEYDRLVPQAWAEEVTRLLPNGRLSLVPAAAHTVPYARAAELARLVDRFASEVHR